MATEAEAPPKAVHTLNLTRAALYLLEGCLQDNEACTTPAKMAKWARLWEYVRKANNRMITVSWADGGKIDIEKQAAIRDGEKNEEFQRRVVEHNEAFARWQNEPVVLELNDKRRDIARDAVKYAIEHKKLPLRSSAGGDINHTLVLLDQLKLGDDEE